jgi:hypothetical protein
VVVEFRPCTRSAGIYPDDPDVAAKRQRAMMRPSGTLFKSTATPLKNNFCKIAASYEPTW